MSILWLFNVCTNLRMSIQLVNKWYTLIWREIYHALLDNVKLLLTEQRSKKCKHSLDIQARIIFPVTWTTLQAIYSYYHESESYNAFLIPEQYQHTLSFTVQDKHRISLITAVRRTRTRNQLRDIATKRLTDYPSTRALLQLQYNSEQGKFSCGAVVTSWI